MDPIIVVGAGLAGVTCARTVHRSGLPVVLRERSRVLGGRMASRTLHDRPVDLGASYLTVADPRFAAQVGRWRDAGLAHPWTDTFASLGPEGREDKQGPMRWGARRGLRSLVEQHASGLGVRRAEVGRVVRAGGRLRVDGEAAAAVVLAMPDPQAARLLGAGLDDVVLDRTFEPTLALVARWEERGWDLDGAFVNGDDALTWIADDGSRRGDDAPALVAHSTPALAAAHLDDPDAAVPAMLDALCRLLDLPEPVETHVHRWTYAKPTGERVDLFGWWDGLGVCGDGWGPVSKVEGAYLSGLALGEEIVRRLG